ncbi:glutathione S-transferase family protein [Pararhodobacter aggregans]|uniref:Glutathione S-transferase n=1 Tax=Pararhodobacter aggregans TaxID=404875 RepID=A0A2T7UK50_9RHOB|nr:glutathione S-transferase family protein [Pararhodobacter aggregans]PTW98870.1 glutathione S-transferase [Pararhodobacter aggregans]PVE45036.1 glutathione S-transferase [Pararhodobacter aggregans]
MIDFYTNPRSRGAIARWMLEEVGAPYREHRLEFGTTIKAAEYLAINPMGKVPAIVHEGQTVTEAAAICAYLADAFPEAGLAPPPAERGAYYRWLFFGAGPVEAAVVNNAMGFVVPPERKVAVGYGSLDDVVETLEARLEESPYLAGERFTAADVYAGSQIGWGMMFGTLPTRPVFEAYWNRIKDRPARAAAAAKDAA